MREPIDVWQISHLSDLIHIIYLSDFYKCLYSILGTYYSILGHFLLTNNVRQQVKPIICLLLEPRACGRPEQPPNSTMTVTTTTDRNSGSAYEVGATVDYTCNAGSLLIGPSTRTCLDTGFYNEFPPVCKSKRARIRYRGHSVNHIRSSYRC